MIVRIPVYQEVIKDKAKNKPENMGFCNYVFCMRYVRLRDDNTCIHCGSPVSKKEITYAATMEKFDKILDQIMPALNDHIFSERELDGLKIPVQIGIGNKEFYFVPLRYFVEYLNFKQSDDYIEDKKSIISFIEYIKKVSPKSKL